MADNDNAPPKDCGFRVINFAQRWMFNSETGDLQVIDIAIVVEVGGMVRAANGQPQQWAVAFGVPRKVSGTYLKQALAQMKQMKAEGKTQDVGGAGLVRPGPRPPSNGKPIIPGRR